MQDLDIVAFAVVLDPGPGGPVAAGHVGLLGAAPRLPPVVLGVAVARGPRHRLAAVGTYAGFVVEDIFLVIAQVRHRTADILSGLGRITAVLGRAAIQAGGILPVDDVIRARENLQLVVRHFAELQLSPWRMNELPSTHSQCSGSGILSIGQHRFLRWPREQLMLSPSWAVPFLLHTGLAEQSPR